MDNYLLQWEDREKEWVYMENLRYTFQITKSPANTMIKTVIGIFND